MHLSRIRIENFRTFSEFDVKLAGNVVIVGENRVGKSNLLHALRLIFDASLPDSARQLNLSDFWDELATPCANDIIEVLVEIEDFEDDLDVIADLTDYRLDDDPQTVRLTYQFRPLPGLDRNPASESDYEFICFGGEDESKRFGYDLRRRIALDMLPALRDAEGDLSVWRRSPLRPLIEEAFSSIDADDLEKIGKAISEATDQLAEFEAVETLQNEIAEFFRKMSGPRHDIEPTLGFTATDTVRLYRSIRLLTDGGKRGIAEASLGSANLIFLTLKALELKKLIDEGKRDHSLLAIEEPEAHLHPHLQRSVYRHLFETMSAGNDSLSVLLTTHSPHIASVAPLRSIVLLKETKKEGTIGKSTAKIGFSNDDVEDLTRYLDVTRAEILFARGVILVEGDAERFLVPVFAEQMKVPLDHLGISVCSVGGTNFRPYAKLLAGLGIPFAVITDWDPVGDEVPLGYTRSVKLASTIYRRTTGKSPDDLVAELDAYATYEEACNRCEQLGIFSNNDTLEIDLFDGDFIEPICEALREGPFGEARLAKLDAWRADKKQLDAKAYLDMIEVIGKGRFAQRLATRIWKLAPPSYIARAIKFVADSV